MSGDLHYRLLAVVSLLAVASIETSGYAEEKSADVIVYGGSPGGVAAAVAASRAGKSVIVVEPRKHLGGLMSGGLSKTDLGPKPQLFGGIALEVFRRANAHYGTPWSAVNRVCYHSEPHVAEKTFVEMLKEAKVPVETRGQLRSVETSNGRVTTIEVIDGRRFTGKYFIDASYEGDLMAKAGVSTRVGREDRKEFDELHAGFQPAKLRPRTASFMSGIHNSYVHGTPVKISPYTADGKLLPGIYINANPWPKVGTGDRRLMGNGYRLSATRDPNNMVPWPKPKNYDPKHYELVNRLIEAFPGIRFERFVRFGSIGRNGKYDGNNSGSIISTNHIGMNCDYSEADWARRDRIEQEHRDWQQGLLWFLSHDASVPERIRKEASRWGLAKDEFVDNGHWPYHLYTREVRRMVGQYVMTEHDVMRPTVKPDAICMGAFILDSHAVQRLVHPGVDPDDKSDDYIIDEGNYDIGHPPFQIPYRSIMPKKSECENLLVPVCISATHVALGAIRMEPQYMMMGHAAGAAAALAIDDDVAVQDVDYAKLRKRLLADKQVVGLK